MANDKIINRSQYLNSKMKWRDHASGLFCYKYLIKVSIVIDSLNMMNYIVFGAGFQPPSLPHIHFDLFLCLP